MLARPPTSTFTPRKFCACAFVINELLAYHSGQPIEQIEKDVERDFIMTAEQAKEYGMIDEIITKHR